MTLVGFYKVGIIKWSGLPKPLNEYTKNTLLPSNCKPGDEGIGYHDSGLIIDFKQETDMDVKFDFTLLAASSRRDFSFLVFIDEKQYFPENAIINIDCGETKTLDFHINGIVKPHVVTVFTRQLPIVPHSLEGKTAQGLEGGDLELAAYDFSDFSIKIIGPPLEFKPANDIKVDISFESELGFNYLYEKNPTKARYLKILDSKEELYDFGVRFQNQRSEYEPDEEIVTLTCLLDDRQFPAFNNQLTWSGKLEDLQVANISARAKGIAPGWHQLRCIRLNSLFIKEEDYGYETISSTYIYKE